MSRIIGRKAKISFPAVVEAPLVVIGIQRVLAVAISYSKRRLTG